MIFSKRRRALEAEIASLRRQMAPLNYLVLRVAILEEKVAALEQERTSA